MSVSIMCLTSSGGLPLFVRKKGDIENLPFSTIASLNGVHMFGKSHGVEILSTETEDGILVWKSFHDSVTLIGSATGSSEEVLSQILEYTFNAMVLTVGIEDIKTQRNAERLKRDLRIAYPIIDKLLDCIETNNPVSNHTIDIIGLTEAILCSENHLLQTVLDTYTECLDSLFGCILIHGRIAVATKSWWTLHADERKLISLLISSDNTCTARDVPIFLPFKSPDVAFRLVTCVLITNIEVCTICGPTPELCEVDHVVIQCFKSVIDILRAAEQCYPKNFPNSLQLDSEILGLLLINLEYSKFMLSRNPQLSANRRSLSGTHRLDILRTFYYESVYPFLVSFQETESEAQSSPTLETYWCSEYHKCHAVRTGNNILCVLYTSVVPSHTMRLISQKTLKDILSDKQLCW